MGRELECENSAPQDTNELTGERSWWEKIPEDRKKTARDEKDNTTEVVSKAKVGVSMYHIVWREIQKY